ncbi:MAG: CooT family nickel-binding protein [Deltaproteobacteria bacterium]|nr:CooT family nickel-binding protein [Deltaproteobacteria bacterium]
MCEAHAYIIEDNREKRILESVDVVDFEGDEVRLVNIFGEQKTMRARLARYNSREGKLVFEPENS